MYITIDPKNHDSRYSWLVLFRRDTDAEWAKYNLVLEKGEPGIDTEFGLMKIGDGVTPWVLLEYATIETMISLMEGEG